ncbi:MULTISPECIES: hypothetical protein [unclassified Sphingopyxis]|jgi:hypothetical protein|uniref:hypothetical protein n=1 Tax=unclassified Sphingopyxis TaxID=2614943 RepID=UPI00285AB861|nr:MULTISPECIES: hypothetical protein [unclassified Sphingopyxis]MDR6832589.1 hypothetical protein [Sphingopyxis sp. BE122]MDR7228332.1 hypothetical protein [Sphingopyxis sp. BE259]
MTRASSRDSSSSDLLGYGLGPLFIGLVSDFIFHAQAADMGGAHPVRAVCEGGARAALSQADQGTCAIIHPLSLKQAMLIAASFYIISGLCFLLTCRWLNRDMVAR